MKILLVLLVVVVVGVAAQNATTETPQQASTIQTAKRADKFTPLIYNYADFVAAKQQFRWDPQLDRPREEVIQIRAALQAANQEAVAVVDQLVDTLLLSGRATQNNTEDVDLCTKYDEPRHKYSSRCYISILNSLRYSNKLVWNFINLTTQTCNFSFGSNHTCVQTVRQYTGHMLEYTRLKDVVEAEKNAQTCPTMCQERRKRLEFLKTWTDERFAEIDVRIRNSIPTLAEGLASECMGNEVFRNRPEKAIDAAHASETILQCYNRVLGGIYHRNSAYRYFEIQVHEVCKNSAEPWRCRRQTRVYAYYALKKRVRAWIRFLSTMLSQSPFYLKF